MYPIDQFFRRAALTPDTIAVEQAENALSYGELAAEVRSLAFHLQQLDQPVGSRVGICAWNTLDHLKAWMAVFAAGKTWIPLNPRNGRDELDRIIAATEPGIVFLAEDCSDRLSPPKSASIISMGDSRASHSIDAAIARNRGAEPARHTPPLNALQAIKFTGGSSGQPKGCMQSYRTWNSCIASMLAAFGFDAGDCHLIAAPMTHGANTLILPVFSVGGRQVMLPSATPALILDAIENHAVTTCFVPPTLAYALMTEQEKKPRNLASLRHLIIGGAALRAAEVPRAMALFNNALETCFGQTEAPQIITCMRSDEWRNPALASSAGRPTVLTEIAIMDEAGKLLPAGTEGELVIRGDLVMEGYFNMPEVTAATIRDGWLHTGDIALLDDKGYLFVRDRLRDVIISGGFNIYPSDVEAVLGRHQDVAECVVFGLADDYWGERVTAAVELKDGSTADAATLIGFVKTELDSVKAPKQVFITDALPRSPVGKVLRREAKAHYAATAEESLGDA